MELANKVVGFAITGSFCTIADVLPQMQRFVDMGAKVVPILSASADEFDTRFIDAASLKAKVKEIVGGDIITSVVQAEPIGPRKMLDVLLVAPCTGNTLAKVANGITDTAVTMAVKAHLRNDRPVALCVSTNDGLGGNAKNIGLLMNMKNIFFVPFRQDDPVKKSKSLVSDCTLILPAVIDALNNTQLQPMILGSE